MSLQQPTIMLLMELCEPAATNDSAAEARRVGISTNSSAICGARGVDLAGARVGREILRTWIIWSTTDSTMISPKDEWFSWFFVRWSGGKVVGWSGLGPTFFGPYFFSGWASPPSEPPAFGSTTPRDTPSVKAVAHRGHNSTKTPERGKKTEIRGGREEKKREILASHPSGLHPSGQHPS